MYESTDTLEPMIDTEHLEPRDECGCAGRCPGCDPDTWIDLRAELLAGQRGERW